MVVNPTKKNKTYYIEFCAHSSKSEIEKKSMTSVPRLGYKKMNGIREPKQPYNQGIERTAAAVMPFANRG